MEGNHVPKFRLSSCHCYEVNKSSAAQATSYVFTPERAPVPKLTECSYKKEKVI